MLRESWKRPSLLLVGWATVLVLVFVLRGDLRVEPRSHGAARATADEPTVVRPQRPERPEAATIVRSGRVFDAMGFLVVGAEVATADRELARTDADGRFLVDLAAGQGAEVTVNAPGHRPLQLRITETGPEPLLVQLSPVAPWDVPPEPLPPLRFAGEGRVLTADGRPVSGALVTGVGSDAWARTDASGRYVLPLAGATPTIAVHHDGDGGDDRGLFGRSEPLQLDRERGMVPLPDLVAVAASTLRGIVRDASGVPVAGVPVRLRGLGLERLVETGAGGAFRIGGLEPGDYTVRPFAFRGAVGMPLSMRIDRAICDCELSLQPIHERRLRVLDTAGAPVAEAAVAASFAGERTSVQRTDADGWTRVGLAEGALDEHWAFDVRVGTGHAAAAVTRFEPARSALIVAMH